MNVDKSNGNVCFNEQEHIYWNKEDNKRFVSVTTMIHSFTQEFDSEFWSAYKAIEKLIGLEAFKAEKKRLLETHKVDMNYFEGTYGITKLEFNRAQQEILDKWQEENHASCERGTAIHSELETQYYKQPTCSVEKYGIGGKFTCKKDYYELDLEKGVYPEYLIYIISEDGKFRLAGQIDLLIKDGNDIYIVDYKTNKELKSESGFDVRTKKKVMMKYPMSNLMDCNMNHYTLQLSTYAWMLQQINPNFVIKKLILVHYDHKGNVTTKEVEYLKSDVERMCRYYKKQQMLEEKRSSRKPIEY